MVNEKKIKPNSCTIWESSFDSNRKLLPMYTEEIIGIVLVLEDPELDGQSENTYSFKFKSLPKTFIYYT